MGNELRRLREILVHRSQSPGKQHRERKILPLFTSCTCGKCFSKRFLSSRCYEWLLLQKTENLLAEAGPENFAKLFLVSQTEYSNHASRQLEPKDLASWLLIVQKTDPSGYVATSTEKCSSNRRSSNIDARISNRWSMRSSKREKSIISRIS